MPVLTEGPPMRFRGARCPAFAAAAMRPARIHSGWLSCRSAPMWGAQRVAPGHSCRTRERAPGRPAPADCAGHGGGQTRSPGHMPAPAPRPA